MSGTKCAFVVISLFFLVSTHLGSAQQLPVNNILEYVVRQYAILTERVSGEVDFISTGNPLNSTWNLKKVNDWTVGFHGGSLWMLYKLTKDSFWRNQALLYQERVKERQFDTGTHDVGFVIMSTFGLGLEFTGNTDFIPVIVTAAESLCKRYIPVAGVIRSWNWGEQDEALVIVDNMMNLELLLKAHGLTNGSGPTDFVGIVANHSMNTMKNHFRPDGTSYHVVAYNETDGSIVRKFNHQGYSDESAWSRGLAWGIHGFTTVYEMIPSPEKQVYLQQAETAADYFIRNLPEDSVPYYDFMAPIETEYSPRDTSAGVIAAHAFLKLHVITGNQTYFDTAEKILEAVVSDKYRADGVPQYNIPAIMVNGTVFFHENDFNTAIVYADFYFLRALDLYINLTGGKKN